MSGGISYVIDRVVNKHKQSARKGSYYLWLDNTGVYNLQHYGTDVLSVNKMMKAVWGGYSSVSTSGAINQVLNALNVPCHWRRSQKEYGFWCSEGWTGNPSGPKHLKEYVEMLETARKAKKERRLLERSGGLFRIPGRRYKPYAIKRMAEMQEEYLRHRRQQ